MSHKKRVRYARLLQVVRRTWVYVQRPAVYEIAPCACGNSDCDWSEYRHRLWCQKCRKDFVPEHNGIFDGPIPVEGMALMGIYFDRYIFATGKVEEFKVA